MCWFLISFLYIEIFVNSKTRQIKFIFIKMSKKFEMWILTSFFFLPPPISFFRKKKFFKNPKCKSNWLIVFVNHSISHNNNNNNKKESEWKKVTITITILKLNGDLLMIIIIIIMWWLLPCMENLNLNLNLNLWKPGIQFFSLNWFLRLNPHLA